jgi:hypothetical protein
MSILHEVAAVLTKQGIGSELLGRSLLIPIRGGAYGTRIVIDRPRHTIRLRVFIPLLVPELRVPEVRKAIRLLNRTIESGGFVLAKHGEVYFRDGLLIPTRPIDEQEISHFVFTAWRVVATFSTGLVEVALGNRDPSTALASSGTALPLDLRDAVRSQG